LDTGDGRRAVCDLPDIAAAGTELKGGDFENQRQKLLKTRALRPRGQKWGSFNNFGEGLGRGGKRKNTKR